jgi:hypothetical protein
VRRNSSAYLKRLKTSSVASFFTTSVPHPGQRSGEEGRSYPHTGQQPQATRLLLTQRRRATTAPTVLIATPAAAALMSPHISDRTASATSLRNGATSFRKSISVWRCSLAFSVPTSASHAPTSTKAMVHLPQTRQISANCRLILSNSRRRDMESEADRATTSRRHLRRAPRLHCDRGVPIPRVRAGSPAVMVAAAPAGAPAAGGDCCRGGAGGAGSQQWVGRSGALESDRARGGSRPVTSTGGARIYLKP